MPTAAQTALARGHAVLFESYGEAATWAVTGGTAAVQGVRQVQPQPGFDGRGPMEETVFIVRRADLPTNLPTVGEPISIGGIEHRLAAIRPGQMPGTLAFILEETVR